MVTLNALNTASVLLGRSMGSTSSTANSQSIAAAPSISSGVSSATGFGVKSASSAIFNAVAAGAEKQDKSVDAVLDYIKREFTDFDKKFANFVQAFGHEEGTQAGIADAKEQGRLLTAQVLADPTGIHQRLEELKVSRPGMSPDGVMSILIKDLNRLNGR